MKVKKEWFEQAVYNWATDDGIRTSRSFTIEGLNNVLFICKKGKTVSRCSVYFRVPYKGKVFSIRMGDWFSGKLEDATRKSVRKFSSLYPLNFGEIERLAKRVYEVGLDWCQVLVALKTRFPYYNLEQMLKHRTLQNSIALERSKPSIGKSVADKPKVVAGASTIQAKPIVSTIDPIKEVKLKNLEQELELIDLKIRKCEILKEISALKNG